VTAGMLASMPTSRSTPRPRARTQAERRAETREALLEATIESLVEYGYAKTTTGRIAELAGVSRGAQIPYFRSRSELVAAAVTHLSERRIQAFDERFAGRQVTVEEGLDFLWDVHQGPVFSAALELWVASRTDEELREELVRCERRVATAIAREAAVALGPAAQREGFTDDLIFALATIRGLALLRISNGDSSRVLNRRWREARERLVRILS
jgi:AcrR family transcriptional regulator